MQNQIGLHKEQVDYERIEQAIRYLEENFKDQPDLEDIAASVHLSKYHFHRLFKRWAGVTPTQFLQYLTLEYAKAQLRESNVLDTSLDAGLSSPSRLHDLFVTFEGVTPGEYKTRGKGVTICYGYHPTPFGECLVATTDRGVCALRFVQSPDHRDGVLAELKEEWPNATLVASADATKPIIDRLFDLSDEDVAEIHLFVKGTNFQIQVWRALLAIPPGAIVSYQTIAEQIGAPTAVRAVANAVAKNPVGYIIPCHRVISKVGKTHRYRWGATRKKAILGWEASRFGAS